MNYKYNEEEYGKLILNKGFQSQYLRYELVVLVKYLKYLNYTRKATEEKAYEFCNENIPNFNKVKYFKVIDGAIRDGRKGSNKLIVLKHIDLMKVEIETIDRLDIGHEYKKLLLAFMCKRKISYELSKIIGCKNKKNKKEKDMKYYNINGESIYFSGSKKIYKDIFETSNIVGKYKVNDMINELVKKQIITSPTNNKGDLILDFMRNIIHDGEMYEEISDFDNIGYIFDYYKTLNNVKRCRVCNTYFKARSNKTKYCPNCAKEIKLENDRRIQKERYYNSRK